ncbi:YggS family pyridoxal phosphate-dependent enzyme [Geosporobacter ferrireducens]|uniref:Pyridoxal phosphate homeostasis protein n=1 Tax=Geosporobacter ferrireducens TaxID=1424294 RepID=A0A1D8GBZ7_9FIRM|nr:YggS family pyridoxal phosphate-dependent enzyme [Geosporobacter ferrireducens]AOT68437.1 YggS family pyridoxal phosphate enzyme [Geosporobacter ferrireducens]MTI53893.1 YggS family pyridoxal phosphate-dependent enzyme [Geosporobacter ferrireducens]
MSQITDNITDIRQEIADTCKKLGKKPEEVQLIAVTKTIEPERINEAIANGITDIGENKVQEIMDKYTLVSPINWHMIGHLQTNKVKYIIDKVKLIHSLDRISLAEEIQKRAERINRAVDVLVQVNIGQEETKSGIEPDEVYDFVAALRPFSYIQVKGLMTVAPYKEDPEEVRPYFNTMKEVFERIRAKNLPGIEMKYLSMGMTNDYKVAIEEGANIIRVGTAIFGSRIYRK